MAQSEFHRQLADLGYNPAGVVAEAELPPDAVASHVEAFLVKHKPEVDVSDRIALKNLGAQLRSLGVDRNAAVLKTIQDLEDILNTRMIAQESASAQWIDLDLQPSSTSTLSEQQIIRRFLETGHAKELDLTGKQAIALAIDCRSKGLQNLDLSFCRGITDDDIRILTQNCPELKMLSLAGCPKITDRSIGYLAATPQLAGLEFLGLEGCAGITDAALQLISNSFTFSHVETLNLHLCSHLTNKGIKWLVRSRHLKALKHLDISACFELSDDTLAALSGSGFRLESLDLSSCDRMTDLGVGFLADSPAAENLSILSLHGCHGITDQAVRLLAESPFIRSLRELDLSGGCRLISETGIELIGSSKNFTNLHSLMLGDCPGVTDHAITKLAGSPHLSQLTKLDLSACAAVTDSGIQAIIKSPYLVNLAHLNVSLTQVTSLGQEMLKDAFPQLEVVGS